MHFDHFGSKIIYIYTPIKFTNTTRTYVKSSIFIKFDEKSIIWRIYIYSCRNAHQRFIIPSNFQCQTTPAESLTFFDTKSSKSPSGTIILAYYGFKSNTIKISSKISTQIALATSCCANVTVVTFAVNFWSLFHQNRWFWQAIVGSGEPCRKYTHIRLKSMTNLVSRHPNVTFPLCVCIYIIKIYIYI